MRISANYDPLRAITERQFQDNQVIRLAEMLGYIVYHTHDSRRSNAGFPDLVMVHPDQPGRVIIAELKRVGGRPTDEQVIWLSLLNGGRIESYLWDPRDYSEIEAVLMRRNGDAT